MTSNNLKRIQNRHAALSAELGREPTFCAIVCNGCGRLEAGATPDAVPMDGWLVATEPGGADYCPTCRPADDTWAGSFPKPR